MAHPHVSLATTVWTLAATLSAACISNPARGTAGTGQPLRVRFDTSSGTYQAQEVVGEDQYYDRDGNAAGSVQRSRAVTKRWANTDVSFYQGDDRLDEQDYFHLAGNRGAVDEIKAARAQMSRDLSIGFPVAIAGAAGSTLAAIGTFGDSKVMRFGVSTGLTAVALAGAYFALRGMETYRKKPLLDASRAIKHAQQVDRCYRGACRSERGGAATTADAAPAASPAPAPAPTSLAMRGTRAWLGTWTGSGHAVTRSPDGRSLKKASTVELRIDEATADSLTLVLEPNGAESCKLTAHMQGGRAELTAGQSCRRREGRSEIALTVRDGSSLVLRDGQLVLALEVDLALSAPRRGKAPRVTRLVSSMEAVATRLAAP
ncbi:MAG: hypothetical protein IPQ07_21270 [Myxococcales bacterium]|nr:hypothetical protein [Myxococcales bacterium]